MSEPRSPRAPIKRRHPPTRTLFGVLNELIGEAIRHDGNNSSSVALLTSLSAWVETIEARLDAVERKARSAYTATTKKGRKP